VSATVVDRKGQLREIGPEELNFQYRQTELPADWIILSAIFEGAAGDSDALEQRMADQLAKRDATQPTKERSAGSTFRNPAGFSSTGKDDDTHELKAWKVIEDAGLRGAQLGGAQMSEKHPNFMINTGNATAEDLENLGEEVRKKVFQNSGISLVWEIMRVGEPASE
jgi:UDP-N-acetylmuramate dehydrogenase